MEEINRNTMKQALGRALRWWEGCAGVRAAWFHKDSAPQWKSGAIVRIVELMKGGVVRSG